MAFRGYNIWSLTYFWASLGLSFPLMSILLGWKQNPTKWNPGLLLFRLDVCEGSLTSFTSFILKKISNSLVFPSSKREETIYFPCLMQGFMHISSILQNYFLHCKIYILSHPIAPKVRITKILCFRYLFCNFKMTKYVLLHSCRTHHTFKMVLVDACLNPHPHAVSSKLCDVYI